MLKVQITSSGVIFFPSCQIASSRIVYATHERSSGHSILSAIRPYSVKASSLELVVRVSYKFPIPAAAEPFKIKGLKESYDPVLLKVTFPPFRAFGLT